MEKAARMPRQGKKMGLVESLYVEVFFCGASKCCAELWFSLEAYQRSYMWMSPKQNVNESGRNTSGVVAKLALWHSSYLFVPHNFIRLSSPSSMLLVHQLRSIRTLVRCWRNRLMKLFQLLIILLVTHLSW